jgi:cell wall assembly regulator SMI1
MKKSERPSKPESSDDLAGLLKRLDAWLKKNRKRFHKGLRPGATAQELADLERTLGCAVPADLAALLGWHNGQSDDVVGGFVDDWRLMSAAQIGTARAELNSGKETGWQPGFVPFLEDDRGECVVLDTTAAGVPVREWRSKEAETVAPSLRSWLEQFVAAVEAGKYAEDPERGTFLRQDGAS